MTSLLSRLNRLAMQASQRSDVIIASFMMLAVAMIIIPLPTPVVDALIGINIAFSLLILIGAFYIRHPVEFSALPPMILLSTLFRLALSITTTRLILLQADAGEIVSAFGHFVIAGQVVIGLVVFFIIAIAQFVVITKGAERVAEVAARFVLDAMPGKQMSIDSDARNGDIEPEEARRRRSLLERESQLYGAMDGAMKFVKGDAIAVLVILFINLIGGLLVGMLQHGMPFQEAIRTYSLLTVGDGLIAQIPALLISVGAGTVVTRVSADGSGDLGSEIVSQLGQSDRALALVAVILAGVAFIPGFTTAVFLAIAAGLGAASWLIRRRRLAEDETPEAGGAGSTGGAASGHEAAAAGGMLSEAGALASADIEQCRIILQLGSELFDVLTPTSLDSLVAQARRDTASVLGIDMPNVGWRMVAEFEPATFAITLDEVPVVGGQLPDDQRLLPRSAATLLDEQGVAFRPCAELLMSGGAIWIDADQQAACEALDIAALATDNVLQRCLMRMLRDYSPEFIGIQETRNLLASMEGQYPELVAQVTGVLSLQQIADVFRRLVEEGIAIRPLRAPLEALAEHSASEANVASLCSRVRESLARRISHAHAADDGVLRAWVVTRELEQLLASIGERIRDGGLKGFPNALSDRIKASLGEALAHGDDQPAVMIASAQLRRPLFEWARRQKIELAVMSWREISPEFDLQSLGRISPPVADDESVNAPRYDEASSAARA